MKIKHFAYKQQVGTGLPGNPKPAISQCIAFSLVVIFLVTDSLTALCAETPLVTLTQQHEQYSLNSAFDYLEDPDGQLTLAMVSTGAMADQFTHYQGNGAPNFGTTTSAFWLRFHWHNPLDTPQTVFLDIENALLDDVSIYQLDADNRRIASWRTGDTHPFSTRAEPQRTFVFQLVVPPEHSGSVYARIQSVNMLSFPAKLWQPAAFRAHLERVHIIIGIYFGIMLVMAFYNSFLYAGTREQAYLIYVLYLFAFMLFQATLMGLVALYWQEASPWWINRAPLLTNPLAVILTALFVRSFLCSDEHFPILDKLITTIVLIGVLIIFGVLFTNALHTIEMVTQIFDIAAVLVAIVASAMIWRRGLKIARFFLIAWSVLMASVVVNVLKAFSILPSIWLTDNAVYIGSILEVTLLSIALADRINVLRQERIDENEANLKLQKEFNLTLEKNVAERTKALEEANQRLEELSNRDGLTQLYNRRFFDARLDEEFRRAQRQSIPLSLILCDVDYFKKYNDTYGHQAGDDCLQKVAQALTNNARRVYDVPARYGGEEFAVILPHATPQEACQVAENIRLGLEAYAIPHEKSQIKPVVSMSFGVASTSCDDMSSIKMLLKCADEALYQSKLKGRDQISIYQPAVGA